MSRQGPFDPAVLQLLCTNLAREGSVRLVEDILCGHFDALAQMLTGEQ